MAISPDPFPSLPPAARSALGPAGEIVLLAVRPRLDTAAADRARELLGRCPRSEVLAAAAGDGASALVHRLAREAGGAPEPLRAALEARARLAAAQSLRLERALADVLDALAARGIPVLLLKGPVLAALYDPPWLREFEDLDLLVRPGDAAAAEEVLRGLGFRRTGNPAPAAAALEDRAEGVAALLRPDGICVDLHSRLSRIGFPLDLDLGPWWDGRRTAQVAGRTVAALAPEALLHLVLLHGSKECWRRRAWLSDVARILARWPGLDGEAVARTARGSGTARLAGVGLALLRATSAAEVPPGPLERLAAEPAAAAAAARLLADPALAPGASCSSPARVRFSLGLRERRGDRWRALAQEVFVPRQGDGEAFPLPPWARPLYSILRPLRLAWRHGRAAVEGRA
jgi:hypothetical protein